ncbi:MAG: InlB B-repeat-containing protein [Lachnospiraceae bacterium]
MKHKKLTTLLAYCLSGILFTHAAFAQTLPVTDQTPDTLLDSNDSQTDASDDTDSDLSTGLTNEITIQFFANNGTQQSVKQTIYSGSSTYLMPNSFQRTGFTFNGWNTKTDGTGTHYADRASTAGLLASSNKSSTIALYAEWSIQPFGAISCKAITNIDYKISFSKPLGASGCQLEYSNSRNFSNSTLLTFQATQTSYPLYNLTPGKTYYVRIRSYTDTPKKQYSSWSAVQKFTIPALSRMQTSSVKVKSVGSALVSYSKKNGSDGYEVQYSQYKDFSHSKSVSTSASHSSATLTGLSSGKTYYVRTRYCFRGKKKTVYSAWSEKKSIRMPKLSTPKLKSVKPTSRMSARAEYSKVKYTQKYEIQYSRYSSFKSAKTIKASGTSVKKSLPNLKPGVRYYVRLRSYAKSGSKTYYSKWSNKKSVRTKKGCTINNTRSVAAIEADVALNGTGSGFHAKLVICTPTSAVSFGIQYDAFARAPYTGKTMALIENISSNNPGGQKYTRPKKRKLKVGKKYHLMLTVDERGKGNVYVNYKKIGHFSNPKLAHQKLYMRIEASGRINGDTVNACFKNVRIKSGKSYDPYKKWGTYNFHLNPGLGHNIDSKGTVNFFGTIVGLPAGGDWDSQYESVSEIIQYVE